MEPEVMRLCGSVGGAQEMGEAGAARSSAGSTPMPTELCAALGRMYTMAMDRRQFLRFSMGVTIALPAGTFLLISCDETGTPNGDTPGAPPAMVGTQVVYTTNVFGDHSHTFGIEATVFASPPAAGISGSTSSAEGHMHSVTVAMVDLQNVQTGQTIKITTGVGDGHTHVITLVKLG